MIIALATRERVRGIDEANKIECFYLLNEPDHNVAIGWAHNLNAWWQNHYYVKKDLQHFLDCTAPSTQTITLPGFAADPSYYITYFPTRMGATEHPDDDEDDHGDGNVRLRFDVPATAALNDTAYFLNPFSNTPEPYLDTLHADYAFIISPAHHVRSLIAGPDSSPDSTAQDFVLFPNPAHGEVFLRFPTDGLKEVTVYDLTGRRVYATGGLTGFTHSIPLAGLAQGPLCVRVWDGTTARSKTFILH